MEKFYVGQKVIIKDNLPKYLTHFIGEVGVILEIWGNKAKLELNLKNYSESVKPNFYFHELKLFENNIKKL